MRLATILTAASSERLCALRDRWRRRAARWDEETCEGPDSDARGWHAPWECAREAAIYELRRRSYDERTVGRRVAQQTRDDAVDRFYEEYRPDTYGHPYWDRADYADR